MEASRSFVVEIREGLSVATAALPNGVVGRPYSVQCQADGGVGPYTWSADGLPDGLTIDETGLVSGTPLFAGEFNPSVTVRDSSGEE